MYVLYSAKGSSNKFIKAVRYNIAKQVKRYFDNNVQLDYHWSVQVLRYKHEEFSIVYFPTANLR